MKAWTTSAVSGRCAADWTHTWPQGTRVFVVKGATWSKTYCARCAASWHAAGPDTGEGPKQVVSKPAFVPLQEITAGMLPRFTRELAAKYDARLRQAGDVVEDEPDEPDVADVLDPRLEEVPEWTDEDFSNDSE